MGNPTGRNELTRLFKSHHEEKFAEHGPTAKGVDWNDEGEMLFRYAKIMDVLRRDFDGPSGVPTILDVGCGWGGLLQYCRDNGIEVQYTGIDLVESMVGYARERFTDAEFLQGDIFEMEGENRYDFVVCNGILTQRLAATIPSMEQFSNAMIRKLFDLCRFGMSTIFMSTRVNFMAQNLYYRNPGDLLNWCLMDLTPKVRLDHAYSSLGTGRGKYYDFTIYLYKD